MVEHTWLSSSDPLEMLRYLNAQPADRKVLLLQAACFRRLWDDLPPWARDWVVRLEAVAEGKAPPLSLVADRVRIHDVLRLVPGPSYRVSALRMFLGAEWLRPQVFWVDHLYEATPERDYAALVRELYGNPFRPVPASPLWLDRRTVDLARGILADQAFDRMPILGDALEEAGCDRPDLLLHCRGEGEHVRGCWLIDALSGRP